MKELDSEGLQAIRDFDAAMGPDEELRFYPPASTHRRQLLRRLDATEEVLADQQRLTRELDVLLNGEEGAAMQPSLCDIVAQVRSMKASRVVPCTAGGTSHRIVANGTHCLDCGRPREDW